MIFSFKALSIFKRYTAYFLLALSLFLAFHLSVWFGFNSKIFDSAPAYVGDLARLGYQIDSIQARELSNTLPLQHIGVETWKDQPIDILSIGDSFANGMAGGKNPYFQDYLASEGGLSVLNIQNIRQEYSYIETILILLNSGWLRKHRPSSILIETVQREMQGRFERPMNWDLSMALSEVEKNLFNRGWAPFVPPLSPINTANYKLPLFNMLYAFSPSAFRKSKVYKLALKEPLFDAEASSTLLLYKTDVEWLSHPNKQNMQRINNNFNRLAELLEKEDIRLYVMPAVDKYDLYEPYIKENPYQKNIFFDLLRPLDKSYRLIDTKAILAPLLTKGVKDVFYADDTHWSYKASHAISEALLKQYNFLQTESGN